MTKRIFALAALGCVLFGAASAATPPAGGSVEHGGGSQSAPSQAVSVGTIHQTVSNEDLSKLLTGLGMKVTTRSAEGTSYLEVDAAGIPFEALAIGCEGNSKSCPGVVFGTVDAVSHPSLETLNTYNSDPSFLRYGLTDGAVLIALPHIVYGGVTDANLEATVATFLNSLVSYAKRRSQASAFATTPLPAGRLFTDPGEARQYLSSLPKTVQPKDVALFSRPNAAQLNQMMQSFKGSEH